jgi:hypothetical protein
MERMMRMMAAMHDMQAHDAMDGAGMPPSGHVEGHLAFLKAELAITDSQAPQWTAFAASVRGRRARPADCA